MSNNQTRKKYIYKVTIVGFLANLLLSALKFFAGFLGRSGAMLADAVHSLSDLITDAIVIIFVRISSKEKDDKHPYGHGKYETLATIIIAFLLLLVGILLIVNSSKLVVEVIQGKVLPRPGLIAFVAAALSIVAKEGLYWYTYLAGKKIESKVLTANAWHHRSDALSSIGTLVGIGGAYFLGEKWRVLDPIAAIVVSVLIIKVAFDLLLPGINELMERSLPEKQQEEILTLIQEDKRVRQPHNLRTRSIGNNIAIEVHIRLEGNMTVVDSHEVTIEIERKLKNKYGQDTLVSLHVEPLKSS